MFENDHHIPELNESHKPIAKDHLISDATPTLRSSSTSRGNEQELPPIKTPKPAEDKETGMGLLKFIMF